MVVFGGAGPPLLVVAFVLLLVARPSALLEVTVWLLAVVVVGELLLVETAFIL
jgi:hypothetical protein